MTAWADLGGVGAAAPLFHVARDHLELVVTIPEGIGGDPVDISEADQSASFAHYREDHVQLPLGLIALYWLRMFKRLVEQDIPQAPGNHEGLGLGFVKDAFWQMDVASPFELRPGAIFAWPRSRVIAAAVGDIATTVA